MSNVEDFYGNRYQMIRRVCEIAGKTPDDIHKVLISPEPVPDPEAPNTVETVYILWTDKTFEKVDRVEDNPVNEGEGNAQTPS